MTEIRNWTLDLATAPTEDLLREASNVRAKRSYAKEGGQVIEEQAYALRLADLDRAIAIRNRRATEALDAQQALSSREIDLLDQGLGCWSSDYNDAPHDEIGVLRERLKVFVRDAQAERSQREQDLREAYNQGWIAGEASVSIGDSGAGPCKVIVAGCDAEATAAEYARSKVGA
jgi:hypothetical protein